MPSPLSAQSAIPLPSAELNLSGTSTSEKNFLTTAASGGVASGSPLMLRLPGSNVCRNRQFVIRAAGRCGGGTGNFTATIRLGNSTTVASNTSLAATGALAMTTAGGSWQITMRCFWDPTSTKIQGVYSASEGAGAAVGDTVLVGSTSTWDATTEYSLATTQTTGVLTVTGTFGSGLAANVAYCDVFEVEVL